MEINIGNKDVSSNTTHISLTFEVCHFDGVRKTCHFD